MPHLATAVAPRSVGRQPIDLEAAEDAVRALLVALGEDVSDQHLRETPRRLAAAYAELLSPRPFEMTTFANAEGYSELVLVTDISFRSLCAHHMLPFHGVAHLGYLPGKRLVGLSKLARVVDWYARGLQLQERITNQVADRLEVQLGAAGVGVVLEAEHQCMSLRGACAVGSRTTSSALRGAMRSDAALRAEFLAEVRGR